MPFSISDAPGFFQREMNKILGEVKGVVSMMDDILVTGCTKEEHDLRLEEVMAKIERSAMTLNKSKCESAVKEVKFLGQIFNKDGIKVDLEKERAIKETPAPTDISGLNSFLAMVNYLSSRILSEIEVPSRELERRKNDQLGPDRQQDSFEKVKVITQAPILALFDYSRNHRVTADASAQSLGAAILDESPDRSWQPVAYASRKLTETKRHYGRIEEALAITCAWEKFDFHLVGRILEIDTDHKPLVPLLGSKDLCDLPL